MGQTNGICTNTGIQKETQDKDMHQQARSNCEKQPAPFPRAKKLGHVMQVLQA
tara:strand:+ start:120 stop:278 length:159 start_codon:yes stop_codon:yes gene_type:complete